MHAGCNRRRAGLEYKRRNAPIKVPLKMEKITRLKSEKSFEFEKFNGSNYITWSRNCELLLLACGLWEAAQTPLQKSDVKLSLSHADHCIEDKFILKQRKAFAKICMTVNDHYQSLLMAKCQLDPMASWQLLLEEHKKNSFGLALDVKRELLALKMKEGENLEMHLARFTSLIDQLAGLGDETSEQDQVSLLLATLPQSFRMMITALEMIPESERTMLHIASKLKADQRRFVVKGPRPAEHQHGALIVEQTAKRNCDYCKRSLTAKHTSKTCWYNPSNSGPPKWFKGDKRDKHAGRTGSDVNLLEQVGGDYFELLSVQLVQDDLKLPNCNGQSKCAIDNVDIFIDTLRHSGQQENCGKHSR